MMNKLLVSVMAALAMSIGAAHAIDFPSVKEGLWQIRTQTTDNPGNKKSDSTVKLCRDHASDKSAEALANNVKGCTMTSGNLGNGQYSAEGHCEVAGTAIVTKGVATFQSDTAVHEETHITYTPAFYGSTGGTMIVDQTYVGSCPAGMKPGDRISQNGTIVHSRTH